MMFGAELFEIGEAAHVPQALHRGGFVGACAHLHVARQMLEHRNIDGFGGRAQRLVLGRPRKVGDQCVERIETRRRIAPEQAGQRREMMPFDRGDFFGREAALWLADSAETAVLLVPPGASGDLRHFRYGQAADPAAVEFLQAREGDMLDVKVQPHADRVGGDEIVDLARFEHCDLRVARLGAERPHDHRRAA